MLPCLVCCQNSNVARLELISFCLLSCLVSFLFCLLLLLVSDINTAEVQFRFLFSWQLIAQSCGCASDCVCVCVCVCALSAALFWAMSKQFLNGIFNKSSARQRPAAASVRSFLSFFLSFFWPGLVNWLTEELTARWRSIKAEHKYSFIKNWRVQ